jgi:septum formation protein
MANPMDGLPRPLILGSGSFTRKLILKEMGIDFHLLVRPIDERNIGDRVNDAPQDLVLTLAKAKCDHLVNEIKSGRTEKEMPHASSYAGWIVLSGDQVVTHNGDILEKPLDVDEARSFVSRYACSPPKTVGAVVLTHVPSGIQVSGVDSATIVFRPSVADADLVDRLLEDGAPVLSCAGGLMVEHPFVREHVERIDGTEDSVMGLSKDLVLQLLQEMRVKLKEANRQ